MTVHTDHVRDIGTSDEMSEFGITDDDYVGICSNLLRNHRVLQGGECPN